MEMKHFKLNLSSSSKIPEGNELQE